MNWIKRYFHNRKIKEQIKFNNARIAALNNSRFFCHNDLIVRQANKVVEENAELRKQLK